MTFYESGLKSDLDGLSASRKLAFMLFLCERMMPALERFSIDTGFNISDYRECLVHGWAYLNDGPGAVNFEEASKACYANAPDTEMFTHPMTSGALNATLTIGYLMSFLADHKIDHIIEAAGLACDTVALYLQSTEALTPLSLSLDEIVRHPLMQRELRRQKEDLKFLASLTHGQREDIGKIRARAAQVCELIPV